jgi:hypothetical protein
MNRYFLDYFRCPESLADFRLTGEISNDAGFFNWGSRIICYGRSANGFRARRADDFLFDTSEDVLVQNSGVELPFDPSEVVENLVRERYSAHFRDPSPLSNRIVRKLYYFLRPCMAVWMRKYFQKAYLYDWRNISFPEWPVDSTVDRFHRKLLVAAMRAKGLETVPFIWFWPDGFHSCAILTHDVEEAEGRDFCEALMDLDESYGFRAAFQVVPEGRYAVPESYLESISSRGFEVNVHDLKHDGRLYAEYGEFLRRAKRINQYGREFGASGFRSGILYRNADWYRELEFSYDTSIPNVAHLDPQRGGCCTVLPYFIGKMVELPLTCTQDYTLFTMLEDYSIDLWKRQIDLIRADHGLVNILVHPDYVIEPRARDIYKQFLEYLAGLRDADHMWTPLPKEVAAWWNLRKRLRLVSDNGIWRAVGAGCERARIAYAHLDGEDVSYSFEA